ncbi:hypothetical protein HOF92_03440 [bacterium]|nr:hypothetical protein [bacterium]
MHIIKHISKRDTEVERRSPHYRQLFLTSEGKVQSRRELEGLEKKLLIMPGRFSYNPISQ